MTENTTFFNRDDSLAGLNETRPLPEKLRYLHESLARRYDFIQRLAIAIYDAKTDMLKTFIHSSGGAHPLDLYQARLSEAASLQHVVATGKPRVINDMSSLSDSRKKHSQRILAEGYLASYTMPMYREGKLFGFVFFDSSRKGVFDEEILHYLDLFGHLVSLTVMQELGNLRSLQAAVETARDITLHRDNETGGHLERMSRYARLIAEHLAPKYEFSDEFVEKVFMFSPLHDVGKIAIPDPILLKPGRLDETEFEIMKTHVDKGREIIDRMLENFGMEDLHESDILRNIAQYHHEAINGEGYPDGLRGDEIPIEARIIAVADIFDALTSTRPYKKAWNNEDAFAFLVKMTGTRLDAECVDALLTHREHIEEIQRLFGGDSAR